MFMRAVHPGQVLKDELEELSITPTEFSRQIDVPPNRVSQIIAGKRSITADTGLRLSRFFGMSDGFWIGLQADYDAAKTRALIGDALAQIQPLIQRV